MKTGRFTLIGSGGSMGIPVVGCHCEVCMSPLQQNKRLRPSAWVQIDGKSFLIDCGPDFRQQALNYHIDQLDGVLLTHAHNDHSAGIDELRIYSLRNGKPLPCLLSRETLQELLVRFYYIFDESALVEGKKITTNLQIYFLEESAGKVLFEGLPITYTSYAQGGMKVAGFRFGNLAYLTDIKEYDEKIFSFLYGIDTLLISALRYTPSPLHFTVDDAIAFAEKAKVKNTWLTHIAHELDAEKTNAYLPASIRVGYDGLELPFYLD